MTKEELFPISEFPFRARQIVEWPERSLRVVVEAYSTEQPESWSDAADDGTSRGQFLEVSSFDGTFFFERMERGDQEYIYVRDDGVFVEVGVEEVFHLMDKFFDVFNERFGIVTGEEADRVMNEKMASTPWEVF